MEYFYKTVFFDLYNNIYNHILKLFIVQSLWFGSLELLELTNN